ncbi:MAG: hypothetical protein R3D84_01900 [Paracoccaceae bacterium]
MTNRNPSETTSYNRLGDDLRAAVAAGIVTEAQAAGILVLEQSRAGTRAAHSPEDEPFEFFRGFSEVFLAVGLSILLAGFVALLVWLGLSSGAFLVAPLVVAGVVWWMAGYFTLKRRMVLPSMILAGAFGIAICAFVLGWIASGDFPNPRHMVIYASLSAAAAMGVWYMRFRLPVAMFLVGLACLGTLYATTLSTEVLFALQAGDIGIGSVFDLRNSPDFAFATLIFGIGAFLAGMWFDMRDPHRLGRHAATGFWLHLLAAPALVNTVALTLYNLGGSLGITSVAAALGIVAALALIIDRRSFLTAGIVYIALVISWTVRGESEGSFGQWVAILLILGAFITALGTWWVALRAALMQALPAFPGKTRLPPYSEST